MPPGGYFKYEAGTHQGLDMLPRLGIEQPRGRDVPYTKYLPSVSVSSRVHPSFSSSGSETEPDDLDPSEYEYEKPLMFTLDPDVLSRSIRNTILLPTPEDDHQRWLRLRLLSRANRVVPEPYELDPERTIREAERLVAGKSAAAAGGRVDLLVDLIINGRGQGRSSQRNIMEILWRLLSLGCTPEEARTNRLLCVISYNCGLHFRRLRYGTTLRRNSLLRYAAIMQGLISMEKRALDYAAFSVTNHPNLRNETAYAVARDVLVHVLIDTPQDGSGTGDPTGAGYMPLPLPPVVRNPVHERQQDLRRFRDYLTERYIPLEFPARAAYILDCLLHLAHPGSPYGYGIDLEPHYVALPMELLSLSRSRRARPPEVTRRDRRGIAGGLQQILERHELSGPSLEDEDRRLYREIKDAYLAAFGLISTARERAALNPIRKEASEDPNLRAWLEEQEQKRKAAEAEA